MKIDGIILDYGGTIDSNGEHWSKIILRAWHHAGIEPPTDVFRDAYIAAERRLGNEAIIRPDYDFHRLMEAKLQLELDAIAERGAISDLSDSHTRQLVQRAADYCDSFARARVRESYETLKLLAERYPLALASNFYGNLHTVTNEYGIADCFRAIIDSTVVGVRKPNPEIFRIAARAIALEPEQTVVIGDSIEKDIKPAIAAGCHAIWLENSGWNDAQTTIPHEIPRIKNLSDIATGVLRYF